VVPRDWRTQPYMRPPDGPYRQPPRRRSSGRSPVVLGLVLAVTVGAGAWYFLFRNGEPSSDFVRAEQRYVEAVQELSAATSDVTFARGDPRYDITYEDSTARMATQLAVFQRLAASEDGEAAELATEAAHSAQLGLSAANALHRALFRTNISDANRAREQLEDASRQLREHVKAWKQL
jgi:hypothetical protein